MPGFDLLCLSHLRWDFVYQRPQHLMTRFARKHRLLYIEEAVREESRTVPVMNVRPNQRANGSIAVPFLPAGMDDKEAAQTQASMISDFLEQQEAHRFILWYYTPSAMAYSAHLRPIATVYDCMDELAAFAGADRILPTYEGELFRRADLVFTGGESLYEAKRRRHPSVHRFPSSVDTSHFRQARDVIEEPEDQSAIPHPRIGFYGVLDERLDFDLLTGIADERADWNLVVVGPIAYSKLNPADIPQRPNIYYLGGKEYEDLPAYLSGWDVALLPFVMNESTRFVSPTKIPEYLAAGRPVVSSPIADVVTPYGKEGLVRIADGVAQFVDAIDDSIRDSSADHVQRADSFLDGVSWDKTWEQMDGLLEEVLAQKPVDLVTSADVQMAGGTLHV
jgi:UDP-galactopyranose mutase